MGIYGPANGGEDQQNANFYTEEVFEVLDTETYDKTIMVGDWNVFLNPKVDQENYKNPDKYRTKTREVLNSQIRTHSLSDIYREENPTINAFTYKDRTGTKTKSKLDYFIVDSLLYHKSRNRTNLPPL